MKPVPISRRALLQRINRALAGDSQVLKVTHGEFDRAEFGDYYIVDLGRHAVTKKKIDPIKLGRELGVIREHEHLID